MTQDACRQVEYPALGRSVLRPRTYRRVNADDPAPWQLALVRLWEQRFLDEYIADVLSDLPSTAIAHLEKTGTWRNQDVRKLLQPGGGGRMFNARQIRRYRKTLGLKGHRGRVMDFGRTRNLIRAKDAEYQRTHGWGYLLTGYNEDGCLIGCDLKRREVDILSALRDQGPMTYLSIARALGLSKMRARGIAYLSRLRAMGLVFRTHHRPFVYSLNLAARMPDSWLAWQKMCLK